MFDKICDILIILIMTYTACYLSEGIIFVLCAVVGSGALFNYSISLYKDIKNLYKNIKNKK